MKKCKVVVSVLLMIVFVFTSGISACAFSFEPDDKIKDSLTSEVLYLVNFDTGDVVYDKDNKGEKKMYPASLTKIMTYIIVAENVDDLEKTIVPIRDEVLEPLWGTDSSVAGVDRYEELSVLDLLYCLMVPSGNDASMVLADYIGDGEVSKFVSLMNAKADELGIGKTTHFTNPHGLHDDDHFTTAKDMYEITKYALTLPYFIQVVNTTSKYLKADDDDPIVNTNGMINESHPDYYYPYASGIKTGTTDEAGHCLVSSATKDEFAYICIAMNAPCYDEEGYWLDTNGAIQDSKTIYEWAFKNISTNIIVASETPVTSIALNYALNKDTLLLVPESQYSALSPAEFDENKIEIKPDVPEAIDAPVQKGDKIGIAKVFYDGSEVAEIVLVADESVEKSELMYWMTVAKNVVTSVWFIGVLIAVAVLFMMYMIIVQFVSKKDERHSRRMR